MQAILGTNSHPQGQATNQVQEAQGAALSVTQTALAVVGGIVGSSLLTVAAFFLIMRYRRSKREKSGGATRGTNIGYPDLKNSSSNLTGGGRIGGGYNSDDAESVYSTDANGYRADLKTPQPIAVRTSLNPGINGRGTPGIGYAVSFYAPKVASTIVNNNKSSMSGTTATTANSGGFQLADPPKKQFSLFPKSNEKGDLSSPDASPGDGRGTPQMTLQRTSKGFVTSLDAWIRAGTVSPFATLKRSPTGGKK